MADFDPWAGQQLGVAEKPEGFDEFWAEQEGIANGDPETILKAREALNRGVRKSKGKGRGRFARYNVVDAPAPRARPTHFVAIRLYSRMIRRNVQQMQDWFVEKDQRFLKCVVPIRKIHSSLLLTSVPDERREDAKVACHEAGLEIRDVLGNQPIKLTCSGVGSFNGQVLFARIRTEPHEMLQFIHDALARALMRHGFAVLDETAKSWLGEGEEPHAFKAHASFIKVSKAVAHATPQEKRQYRSLRVTADDIEAWKDVFFGTQLCHDFELLDMVGTTRDGYYPCMQLEQFNDRPVGQLSSLTAPLAAGPLRAGHLRVECGEAGAGLEMTSCGAGYLVENVLEWPGQPDLCAGEVIVAIGGELLLDLEESDLENRFGKHFADGAAIVSGNWEVIQKVNKESVVRAAERLICPWKRVKVAAEAAETGTEDGISLYTEGGTKLRGKRYQLRTKADSFRPDPLNKPDADPWAKAAQKGHEYPEYSGSGTQFKKRFATKVDWSRFQAKLPTGPRFDADGACKDEEATRLHSRIRKNLLDARTHASILTIIAASMKLSNLSNRILALVRLAACGFLVDDVRKDQRLQLLLTSLEEDLEAIVEADASLKPALIGSLATALGRLKLKKPEIFRALASIARRMGIWTFTADEVTALLEGFSRARLIDEVLFQEVARLVVARIQKIQPRMLTTMLTAFAASNVATEHLFFAAGDAILANKSNFTPGQLAELAEAFSRVRARHLLLLDIVPTHFTADVVKQRKSCSVEALVKLFAAYVDTREEFGPEGFREILAAALCDRRAEMSLKLVRQALQAAARAHWPLAPLLEVASEVAARDRRQWEINAIHDCFAQMRVTAPADFPLRSEEQQRSRSGRRSGSAGGSLQQLDTDTVQTKSHSIEEGRDPFFDQGDPWACSEIKGTLLARPTQEVNLDISSAMKGCDAESDDKEMVKDVKGKHKGKETRNKKTQSKNTRSKEDLPSKALSMYPDFEDVKGKHKGKESKNKKTQSKNTRSKEDLPSKALSMYPDFEVSKNKNPKSWKGSHQDERMQHDGLDHWWTDVWSENFDAWTCPSQEASAKGKATWGRHRHKGKDSAAFQERVWTPKWYSG